MRTDERPPLGFIRGQREPPAGWRPAFRDDGLTAFALGIETLG
jgi:hypothetical protein